MRPRIWSLAYTVIDIDYDRSNVTKPVGLPMLWSMFNQRLQAYLRVLFAPFGSNRITRHDKLCTQQGSLAVHICFAYYQLTLLLICRTMHCPCTLRRIDIVTLARRRSSRYLDPLIGAPGELMERKNRRPAGYFAPT